MQQAPCEGAVAPSIPPLRIAMPEGLERRACSIAVQYWRSIAGAQRYPSRRQVTRESARDLWDHLFIIQVAPKPADSVFVQAGAVLCRALGRDPTGQKVADMLPHDVVARSLYFQRTSCDLMAPIDEAGKWTRPDGTTLLYRSVVMPLSDDQRSANYLLGAFSYRTVA
ncbi:MAG TPA: PAS domain-containing protein [Alphaproteobacteria bacterium]